MFRWRTNAENCVWLNTEKQERGQDKGTETPPATLLPRQLPAGKARVRSQSWMWREGVTTGYPPTPRVALSQSSVLFCCPFPFI